jgi:PAS domain S-box-containing protein
MATFPRPRAAAARQHRLTLDNLRHLLVAAILLFTATAATLFGLIVHEHKALPTTARDNVWWNAVQLEQEYTSLVHQADHFARDPRATNLEPVKLAYDVFYNRVGIAAEGEFAHSSPALAAALGAVRQTVLAAEPLVDTLAPGTTATADRIAELLGAAKEQVSEMLTAAVQVNAAQMAEERATTMRRYVWLGVLLGGLVVSVGLFIVLLVRQLRAIGSAHHDLQGLIDRAGDSVFAVGSDGTVRYANPAAERMFGYAAAELAGRLLVDLLPTLPADLLASSMRSDATHEVIGRNHLGESFDVELTVGEGTLGSAGQYVVFMRDVSARKRSEAAVRHKQKLEMIGQLAGGVAHDFNNLLMIVDGYARRALRLVENKDETTASIGEVLKASQAAAGLTRQLLSFGGKRALDLRTVRLADTIEQAAGLARSSLGESFTLAVAPIDPTLCVDTDPGELTHALLNIIVNARDAMPRGGEIAIAVDAHTIHDGEAATLAAGRYAQISVSDHGSGMDEATLARIFEPFFTTKEAGRGTGLGLAMVYGFAQQSKGTVTATSALDIGSTFYLHLPLSSASPDDFTVPADVPRGHGETILLVEDNPPILQLARGMLESFGYHVLAAEDGITALELESFHNGPIALMVSDVVMPSVSGIELAAILREARPDLKVLFISGYPGKGDIQPLDLPEDIPLLRKPFRPEELAHAVHSAMAGGRQDAAA